MTVADPERDTKGNLSAEPWPVVLGVAAVSDIGRRREENQDSYGIIEGERFKLLLVCDGMGGVKGGAVASKLAVEVVSQAIQGKRTLSENDLVDAIGQANAAILEHASTDPELQGMGTTLVAIAFCEQQLFVASVGDSRAYRIRRGRVDQLTEDHTLVMELVRSGALAAEEAGSHPVSHMLTRSLGPMPTVDIDVVQVPDEPREGDLYLLCSDGLYNLVGSEEYAEFLNGIDIEEGAKDLVALANARGGTDNITVLLIEVRGGFPRLVEEPSNAGNTLTNLEEVVPPPEPKENSVHPDPKKEDDSSGTATSRLSLEQLRAEVEARLQEKEARQQRASGPTQRTNTVASSPWSHAALQSTVILIAVASLAFAIGLLISRGMELLRDPEPVKVVVSSPPDVLRDARSLPEEVIAPLRTEPIPVPGVMAGEPAVVVNPLSFDEVELDERSRLTRRREELKNLLTELEERIVSFSQPVTGRAGEILETSAQRSEVTRRQLAAVRDDIDRATRKLSGWMERRRRLLALDPVNVATELAALSPSVREQLARFQQATWEYLKEYEALRYSSGDASREGRVRQLVEARKSALRALTDEAKRAVDQGIADAGKEISDLTLKRDDLIAELERLANDLEYVRVLTSGDERLKVQKRSQLEQDRDAYRAQLEELEILLGTTVPRTP